MIMNFKQFRKHLEKYGKTKAIPSHIPNQGINDKQIEVVYDIFSENTITSYLSENLLNQEKYKIDLWWKSGWNDERIKFKLKNINNDINFYIENLWKE